MARLDTLHPPRPLGERQQEAAKLVAALPGLTVPGLAHLLGLPVTRAEQIVAWLEALGHLRRRPPDSATSRRGDAIRKE